MSDKYTLHGFSETDEPILLETFDSHVEAETWFKAYVRFDNWGGYDGIGLSEFSPGMGETEKNAHETGLIIIWEKEEIQ